MYSAVKQEWLANFSLFRLLEDLWLRLLIAKRHGGSLPKTVFESGKSMMRWRAEFQGGAA